MDGFTVRKQRALVRHKLNVRLKNHLELSLLKDLEHEAEFTTFGSTLTIFAHQNSLL
jgi:hypothetical protein